MPLKLLFRYRIPITVEIFPTTNMQIHAIWIAFLVDFLSKQLCLRLVGHFRAVREFSQTLKPIDDHSLF